MDRSVTISLGGQEYEIFRARLGKYLLLQEAAANLNEAGKAAAKGGGGRAIIEAILASFNVYIPDLTRGQLSTCSWIEIVSAMLDISILNRIDVDFAILKFSGEDKGLPSPWEYPERMRHYWIHLLAYAYGWSKEDIENIWPEEAYAYLQEIMATEQHEREFVHSLSDIAYSYDQATKKSRYKPLARPAWMVMRDPKSVITRLPRLLMPVGDVQYPEGEEMLRPAQHAELIDTEEVLS